MVDVEVVLNILVSDHSFINHLHSTVRSKGANKQCSNLKQLRHLIDNSVDQVFLELNIEELIEECTGFRRNIANSVSVVDSSHKFDEHRGRFDEDVLIDSVGIGGVTTAGAGGSVFPPKYSSTEPDLLIRPAKGQKRGKNEKKDRNIFNQTWNGKELKIAIEDDPRRWSETSPNMHGGGETDYEGGADEGERVQFEAWGDDNDLSGDGVGDDDTVDLNVRHPPREFTDSLSDIGEAVSIEDGDDNDDDDDVGPDIASADEVVPGSIIPTSVVHVEETNRELDRVSKSTPPPPPPLTHIFKHTGRSRDPDDEHDDGHIQRTDDYAEGRDVDKDEASGAARPSTRSSAFFLLSASSLSNLGSISEDICRDSLEMMSPGEIDVDIPPHRFVLTSSGASSAAAEDILTDGRRGDSNEVTVPGSDVGSEEYGFDDSFESDSASPPRPSSSIITVTAQLVESSSASSEVVAVATAVDPVAPVVFSWASAGFKPAKSVHFPEDGVVTAVHEFREKFDREAARLLFYNHLDTDQFTADFTDEYNRADQARLSWMDWINKRTDEEVREEEQAARELADTLQDSGGGWDRLEDYSEDNNYNTDESVDIQSDDNF